MNIGGRNEGNYWEGEVIKWFYVESNYKEDGEEILENYYY